MRLRKSGDTSEAIPEKTNQNWSPNKRRSFKNNKNMKQKTSHQIIGQRQWNYKAKPQHKETILGKSKTVPGMSISIHDFLIKTNYGQQLPVNNNLDYGDEFGDELNPLYMPNFDLTDLDLVKTRVDQIQKKLAELKKAEQTPKKQTIHNEKKESGATKQSSVADEQKATDDE